MPEKPARIIRFGCPHCKSQDIRENNILPVYLKISAWDEDGEPADYSYPWYERGGLVTDEDGPRYHCGHCDQNFEEVIKLDEIAPAIP
jgi:hypothetical protein